jgi:hypothetical protein
MKHTIFSFLFFLTFFNSLQAIIPPSMAERDEACKKALHQAGYADINYKEKIKAYDSLLPLISFGVSHSVEKKYMTCLKKLFLAREESSFEKNKLLEQLFIKARNLSSLKKEYETLDTWITALNENNHPFALQTGDTIALYLPHFKGYFRPTMENEKIIGAAGPLPLEASQPHPSIVFSISNNDAKNSPIKTDQEYILSPLYYQKETDAYPFAQAQHFKVIFKKNKELQTNLYNKELVQILFADASILNSAKTPLWAKLEKIDNESLHTIENQHFAHQIKKIKIDGSAQELIKQIQTMLTLFNHRISDKHKELVMQELRALAQKRDSLELATLQSLRNTCAQAASFLPSGAEKKECKRWISEINQTIEKNGLCFDDIVILSSAANNKLFTRYNPHSKTEPLLLAHAESNKNMHAQGTELMKISSPDRKTGIIRYGDDITLTPLYASQNGMITRLSQTDGLARRQKEFRGNTCHYLGYAPINLSQAPQKTTFKLLPPPELSSLKKVGACCTHNDAFLLMHHASQGLVTLNTEKTAFQPYVFSNSGTPFFMQKPSEELLNQVHATLVKQELLASTASTDYSKKITHLQKLIHNDKTPFNEVTGADVWATLEGLFSDIKAMSKDEVKKYVYTLLKLAPQLTTIDQKTKNHLIVHACFYQKMQVADSKSGAARLACYHELIPFLKKHKIDAEYKTALLEKIQSLHERKTTEFSSLEKLLELATND